MHPPFMVVDHKIDQDPRPHEARLFEERRPFRRNRPARLDLSAVAGQPHLHVLAEGDPRADPAASRPGLVARLLAAFRAKPPLASAIHKS